MNERPMTPTITCIDRRALKRRVTLKIRNVRKTRTVLNAYKLDAPPDPPAASATISMIESITTDPSKTDILSERYFLTPTASNLRHISTIKIQVNTRLIYVSTFCVSGSIL